MRTSMLLTARGGLPLAIFCALSACAVPVLPALLQKVGVLPASLVGMPSWVLGSLAGCFGLACWTNWFLRRHLPNQSDGSREERRP